MYNMCSILYAGCLYIRCVDIPARSKYRVPIHYVAARNGKVKPICPLCIWCFDSFNSPLRHFMAPVALFSYIILINFRSFAEHTWQWEIFILVTKHRKHNNVYKWYCNVKYMGAYMAHTCVYYVGKYNLIGLNI